MTVVTNWLRRACIDIVPRHSRVNSRHKTSYVARHYLYTSNTQLGIIYRGFSVTAGQLDDFRSHKYCPETSGPLRATSSTTPTIRSTSTKNQLAYNNLVAAELVQHEADEHRLTHPTENKAQPPSPQVKSDSSGDGNNNNDNNGNGSFDGFKKLLSRWWANKDVVAICTILAGTGTLVNVAQQQEQMERQERLEEERRQEAAEEAARNSAERKILVVRGALTTQLKPPQVQLPMCDLYEAEALINRLVQRSPVLVNGYQGTGKSTLLSRMVASRRSDVDVTFNQPAYRLSLRKCLRDRANEPGVLFRLIAEEIGLGKAVQEGFVHDNFENAHQYFVGALEDLRRDGYEPCLFVVDDIEILFNDAHPQLRQQAGGWCEWLLELHEAGLIRLVLVTSAGGVYLDLINFSGFEARLERAHMPELRQARIVDYLLNQFNPHSCDADTLAFDEESAPEFARIFTGFTDILFATSSPSIHKYCETRIRHARNKIKKAIQRDSCYREIFASIPCELADFEERLPDKTLSELEKLLDYLVDRGLVAWTGSTIVWNRKIIREAYQRMKQDEDDALNHSGFYYQCSIGYRWFKRALGFSRDSDDSDSNKKIPLAAVAK